MTYRFTWGTGIALTYAVFALATSTFVAFAMHRRVDLVSADYYAQSLRVDRQMAAERNAAMLGARVSVTPSSDRTIRVSLPPELAPHATGTIRLYRAANARDDREIALHATAQGCQDLSLAGLSAGHWTVQVQWTALGRDYYLQRDVVVR